MGRGKALVKRWKRWFDKNKDDIHVWDEEEQTKHEYCRPVDTLSTIAVDDQHDSSIPPPKQHSSTCDRSIVLSGLADVPCPDLGIDIDEGWIFDKPGKLSPSGHTLSAFIETGQPESSIPVQKQRFYTGSKLVIPSDLANISCADLGTNEVLGKLNAILGTSHELTVSLNSVLEFYISRNDDFGMIYAHLRQYWNYDFARFEYFLRHNERWIQQKERSSLVDGRIKTIQIRCRRVWDLYANRVVPSWATKKTPLGISHAWMDGRDRVDVWTPINRREWPVPIPKDANLDLIRVEMLNLGAEYAWLDVLCLRQEHGLREDLRVPEWKIDVPTIGWVYRNKAVVCYFCGLGRPLRLTPGYFEDDRSWFNRAWTLQEISEKMIIGGETGSDGTLAKDIQVRFYNQLASLRQMRHSHLVFDALSEMKKRASTKPLDKVTGLGYILDLNYLPIYDGAQSEEDAWAALVDAMFKYSQKDLLFFYPEPGDGSKCWRPSWNQIMTKSLPSLQNSLWDGYDDRAEVALNSGLCTNTYSGYGINSGYVRGLSHLTYDGMPRQGELVIKAYTGSIYTFKIIADHTYPIPEDSYTVLIQVNENWKDVDHFRQSFCVVGRQRHDGKFEKTSVFKMDKGISFEPLSSIWRLGISKKCEMVLC
ncbi:uncharacterized protein ARMOST_20428 [Armillaria ostoyae]|uniref:Heterokaryon incompatibility domain-containing protein n=1 Tax=Armillaria ostoyae TaxID=47428 RepID=A0A284S7B4_ARMOS|nr:uncharacterized protein ARMOST_20428 [Armillaria ostoyae]